MASNTQALAQYYAREGYYNKVQVLCNEELRRTADPSLNLWKAFALHSEGSTREAIVEAQSFLLKRDMGLPFASALIFFHNQCASVDRDAVSELSMRMQTELHSAPEASRILAARFLILAGDVDKAREILSPMEGYQSVAVNVALGWFELAVGKKAMVSGGKPNTQYLERASAFFDAGIGSGADLDNLDALMGKAKVLEGKRQWAQALDCLNKVIVMHSWYLPALIEKAKTLMMTADWDQALETAGRLQQLEPNNIEALRLNVLFLLSRESRCDAAADKLQELVSALQQLEPKKL